MARAQAHQALEMGGISGDTRHKGVPGQKSVFFPGVQFPSRSPKDPGQPKDFSLLLHNTQIYSMFILSVKIKKL